MAPGTADGPSFVTLSTYVTAAPGATDVRLSVFVMRRSAFGSANPESDAELSSGFGSSTPAGERIWAVLVIVPVALVGTSATTVNVTSLPVRSEARASMSPLPLGVPQLAPAGASGPEEQLQTAFVSTLGIGSRTRIPETADGPSLPTVILYVTGRPGTIAPTWTLASRKAAVG